jgi:hypothetical protein
MNSPRNIGYGLTAALAFVLSTGCATTSFKNHFTADDFGVGYVDSKNTEIKADDLQRKSDAQFGTLDDTLKTASDVFQQLPAPARDAGLKATSEIGKTMNDKVHARVTATIKTKSADVASYLGNYDIFTKGGEQLGYNDLEPLDANDSDAANLNPMIAQANELLKKSAKVSMTLRVQKEFLNIANKDLASMGPKRDPAKMAGIGLIAASATEGTLSSIRDANTLAPQLKLVVEQIKAKTTGKPGLAFKLRTPIASISDAANNMIGVAA